MEEQIDLRELTNKVLCGEEIDGGDKKIVIKFANYIKAYCSDLKCTEHDL